ncbi:protein kinase [Phytomonospora sp. NPDC050363]|uniref:protein kinase domain-containing protein n=1 Tax=Phytomonospora sp. NPDC050363 TaxID=3155642 RepID=UPI0033ECF2E9
MSHNLSAGPDISGYRDLQLIAHGSTALVFRARQERLDRDVAIKVLSVDEVMTTQASVAKELETTVALSAHPHIVSIIDTGTSGQGQPYIVMEYCEGGSYSQILKQNGPLPVSDVVEVGVKIGEALHAAHTVSILHRDVKPQNILRTKFGPALADFGIARAADELAATGTIDKLTPLHSAPEALRRDEQSPASDVYSLASTMWHLLVGRGPFSSPAGRTDPDEFRQRVEYSLAPSVPRPDVPDWLQRELARALAKDPAARHQSAYAFAEELRRHSYGAITSASVGSATVQPPMPDPSDELTTFAFPPSGATAAGVMSSPAPMTPPAPPPPTRATDPFASPAAYTPPPQYQPQAYTPPPSPSTAETVPLRIPQAQPVSAQPYTPPVSAPPNNPFAVSAPPVSAPPHQPQYAPRPPQQPGGKSRLPLILGGGAGLLVVAILIVVIGFVLPAADKDNGPEQVDGTTDVTAENPPTGLKIVSDDENGVRLEWTDPSAGSLSFIVFGGRKGAQVEVMQTIEPGTTTATISGLNPEQNYCFSVGALYSIEKVPKSNQICTSR